VAEWAEKISGFGVKIIALSDTVGVAESHIITELFTGLIPQYPNVEFGAHFHATNETWQMKIQSAHQAGCLRFDGVIGGFGGCPMAEDELIGNINTQKMIQYFENQGVNLEINKNIFQKSAEISKNIFI
jgi:hydroxymethylglutaryl-CoA lyase